MRATLALTILLCACLMGMGGCQDMQSALSPRGPEAGRIALLTWVLIGGAAAILALITAFVVAALYGATRWRRWLSSETTILGGGVVFPVVTLTILLAGTLSLMRVEGQATSPNDPIQVTIVGERWWWRVLYEDPNGERLESANELRIPVGRDIELTLVTADVIHSFWVPNLAGKVDMIPGRKNRLILAAESPGVSRGQCAEYCGGAHALMSFFVRSMSPEDFRSWRAHEASVARPPATAEERRGQEIFLTSGCPACHTIRGTQAAGTIGPDLTHVGGRLSIGAGLLPNGAAALARWIQHNQRIKPENLMPPYEIFSDDELKALATYLAALT